jgi:hypothetical protein
MVSVPVVRWLDVLVTINEDADGSRIAEIVNVGDEIRTSGGINPLADDAFVDENIYSKQVNLTLLHIVGITLAPRGHQLCACILLLLRGQQDGIYAPSLLVNIVIENNCPCVKLLDLLKLEKRVPRDERFCPIVLVDRTQAREVAGFKSANVWIRLMTTTGAYSPHHEMGARPTSNRMPSAVVGGIQVESRPIIVWV